jgi:hypothetical protein
VMSLHRSTGRSHRSALEDSSARLRRNCRKMRSAADQRSFLESVRVDVTVTSIHTPRELPTREPSR